jgi:hypothetical protein
MTLTFQSLEHEPGSCSVAALGNLSIVVWSGRATGPAIDLLTRVTERLIASSPGGVSGIHLIADKVSLPTPEGRAGLVKLMTMSAERLACVGIVVGGSGFWSSTMRSFITGLRLLTPRSFDLRLYGTVEEVLDWFPRAHEQRTGVHLDRSELASLLEVASTWPAQCAGDSLFQPPDAAHS